MESKVLPDGKTVEQASISGVFRNLWVPFLGGPYMSDLTIWGTRLLGSLFSEACIWGFRVLGLWKFVCAYMSVGAHISEGTPTYRPILLTACISVLEFVWLDTHKHANARSMCIYTCESMYSFSHLHGRVVLRAHANAHAPGTLRIAYAWLFRPLYNIDTYIIINSTFNLYKT